MVCLKNKLTILLLCALVAAAASQKSQGGSQESQGGPHVSQGRPHENQGRARRQAQNRQDETNWTSCDFTTNPGISCQDCNTRLICKPVGGILINCDNPIKPYCNNGICSHTPAEGCSK